VPVFQPQAAALAAITRGVRAAFDADGVFDTGRMATSI
jgi:hypothetical protein